MNWNLKVLHICDLFVSICLSQFDFAECEALAFTSPLCLHLRPTWWWAIQMYMIQFHTILKKKKKNDARTAIPTWTSVLTPAEVVRLLPSCGGGHFLTAVTSHYRGNFLISQFSPRTKFSKPMPPKTSRDIVITWHCKTQRGGSVATTLSALIPWGKGE